MKTSVDHVTVSPAPQVGVATRELRNDVLYLPPLHGQYEAWELHLQQLVLQCGLVVSLGNIVGLHPHAVETRGAGSRDRNSVLVDNVLGSWGASSRWLQLVAPNDVVALSSPDSGLLDKRAHRTLRDAYFNDAPRKSTAHMRVAYSVNGRLVTHGGLTHGEWVNIGRPTTAKKAAGLLNEKYRHELWFGESVSVGSPPNLAANPVFADGLHELYPSWLYAGERCPFAQVTAQSVNNIRGRFALGSEFHPLYWLNRTMIQFPRIGSVVNIRDTIFIGLDVGFNSEARMRDINPATQLWVETVWGKPSL